MPVSFCCSALMSHEAYCSGQALHLASRSLYAPTGHSRTQIPLLIAVKLATYRLAKDYKKKISYFNVYKQIMSTLKHLGGALRKQIKQLR